MTLFCESGNELSEAVLDRVSKGEGSFGSQKLAVFEALDGFDFSKLTPQQKEDAEKFLPWVW